VWPREGGRGQPGPSVISIIVRRPSRSNRRCALVRGGGPQHHAGDVLLAHPGDGGLHQRAGDTGPAFRLVDDDVVDEAGGVAQLLPRERLDAGVDVADRDARPLGDEDDGVVSVDLRAEEVRVAGLGIAGRRDEAAAIELEVDAHEMRAEAAERRQVGARGAADVDGGVWSGHDA
jgi:hypothetical protein